MITYVAGHIRPSSSFTGVFKRSPSWIGTNKQESCFCLIVELEGVRTRVTSDPPVCGGEKKRVAGDYIQKHKILPGAPCTFSDFVSFFPLNYLPPPSFPLSVSGCSVPPPPSSSGPGHLSTSHLFRHSRARLSRWMPTPPCGEKP